MIIVGLTNLIGIFAHFAFVHIAISDRRRFRKDPETVDADQVEKAFERYQVQFVSLREFTSVSLRQSREFHDELYLWMQDQEVIALDAKQHYDHIVPLASLGLNDPCNIQLLCEACNLSKGAAPGRTSHLYESWWKLEA